MIGRGIRIAFALVCMLYSLPSPADEPVAPVEVVHWWVSPGEAAAINTLRQAFESAGGTWIDRPLPDYPTVRARAIDRIVAGYPPAAVQWLAGPDLQELSDLELINETEPVSRTQGWRSFMHGFVVDMVGRDKRFLALPVGIHGENWAWYNKKVFDDLGLPLPADWQTLIDQAPTLRAAGVVPLAIGGGDWELRILFLDVLLATAGREGYRDLVVRRDVNAFQRPEVRRAFDIFGALRGLADDGQTERTWNEATAMVAEGKAAVQFMGDWAKGEFTARGLLPGRDFECRLAPAPQPSYMVVIDMFVLARTDDAGVRGGQALLADVVTSPAVQVEFARTKGAIPIRGDLGPAVDRLDACARRGLDVVGRPGAFLPTINAFDDGPYLAGFVSTLAQFWRDPAMTPEVARDLMSASLSPIP